MMGYRRVSWICGVAASIAFSATIGMAQSTGNPAVGPLGAQKTVRAPCRATGTVCFLGIDPDIYHMPLYGEYIQANDGLICATRKVLLPTRSLQHRLHARVLASNPAAGSGRHRRSRILFCDHALGTAERSGRRSH